jgi:hypothetical protein
MDQVRRERAVSIRMAITAGLTDPGEVARLGARRSEPGLGEDICDNPAGLY